MSKMDTDSIDQFFLKVSEFGKYQKLVVLLLAVPCCFVNAYGMFSMMFMLSTPEHRCKLFPGEPVNNLSIRSISIFDPMINSTVVQKAHQCHITTIYPNDSEVQTDGCPHGWLFDSVHFDETMVTYWDLVCDKEIWGKNMLSVLGGAAVLGCIILSWIQDKYGRKRCFMIALSLYIIGSLASLLSPNLLVFTFVRVFASFPTITTWTVTYIWALEYVGPNYRTLVTNFLSVVYGMAAMSLGLVAYFAKTWIHVGLITTIPFFLCLSYQFIIDESPRWLMAEGRHEEAKVILAKIARWEGKPFDKESINAFLNENEREIGDSHTVTTTTLDLFKRPNLRLKTILITFCFIANAVAYVTITYNVENLGGDLILTYVLLAIVEVPAGMLNWVILERVGRIWPLSIGMTLSGVSCLLTGAGENWPAPAIIFLAGLGKFGISVSYSVIAQLSGELYPTVVRGNGVGFSSVVGDLGNILMPFILLAASSNRSLPMVILGFISVAGGIASQFLPESLHQPMPESLDDGETIGIPGLKSFRDNFRHLTSCFSDFEKKSTDEQLKSFNHANGI